MATDLLTKAKLLQQNNSIKNLPINNEAEEMISGTWKPTPIVRQEILPKPIESKIVSETSNKNLKVPNSYNIPIERNNLFSTPIIPANQKQLAPLSEKDIKQEARRQADIQKQVSKGEVIVNDPNSIKERIKKGYNTATYYSDQALLGFLGGAEDIADGTLHLMAALEKDQKSKEFLKQSAQHNIIGTLKESNMKRYNQPEYSYIKDPYNNLPGKVIETTADMLPSMILGGATGKIVSGTGKVANIIGNVSEMLPFATKAFGASTNQALSEGAEYDDALKYGTLSAVLETGVEMISGGIGGVADKGLKRVLTKQLATEAVENIAKKTGGKLLADAIIGATGEGLEEVASELLNPFLVRLTYDEKRELATKEEVLDSFVMGALSSILLQGGSTLTQIQQQNIQEEMKIQLQKQLQAEQNKNSIKNNETKTNIPIVQNSLKTNLIADNFNQQVDRIANVNIDSEFNNLKNNIIKNVEITEANDKQKLIQILEDFKVHKNSDTFLNDIIDFTSTVQNKGIEHYEREILNYLRKTHIQIDNQTKRDIADYNDFRKANFNRLNLSKEGIGIDKIYGELSASYPRIFSENITNKTDQLLKMAEIVQQLNKPHLLVDLYGKDDIISSTLQSIIKDEHFNNIYNSFTIGGINNDTARNETGNSGTIPIANIEGTSTINQANRGEATNQIIQEREASEASLLPSRKEVQGGIISETGLENYNFDDVNNMSKLAMNRNTFTRIVEKLFTPETAQKIKDNFINPIKHANAEMTRRLNSERQRIEALGIKPGSNESAAVQMYGEGQYVTQDNQIIKYTEDDLKNNFPDNWQQLKRAAEVLRGKYDTYIDDMNKVLNENGYKSISKRPDYFRHFEEVVDLFSQIGIPTKITELPTDINGITDMFNPGKEFFANALRREGLKTTYDAIKGIDGYLDGAMNVIYHTRNVQNLRALYKFITETYGREHGFDNFENLTDAEKQLRLEQINQSHLSEFASWLHEYTNVFAGKKAKIDRSIEDLMGRKIYKYLTLIKKQTGSNMTGLNINTALSNFISSTQAAAKTQKIAFAKGTIDTVKNIFQKDDFINKSDFLITRFGSNKLSNTLWEKINNAGQLFMGGTDYFTANQIVRSKYYEYINKGFSESESIMKADEFADKLMAGRGKGDMPNIFNSQMLGILTQFQLEVNNQMDSIFYDTFNYDYASESKSKIAQTSPNLYNAGMAVFVLGQLFALAYLFNREKEQITGSGGAFDPIGTIEKAFRWYSDDKLTTEEANKRVLEEIVDQIPFASLITGGGRIPISSAIPNIYDIATGDSTASKEAQKLIYLLPPTGGGQLKKTIEGITTVSQGGAYKTNKDGEHELQFGSEQGIKDYLQAGAFGKWALPMGQEYLKGNISKMTAKETKAFENSTIPYSDFVKYANSNLTRKEDKINFINDMNINDTQKWDLYTFDIFSQTERKDGGSQLKDAEYVIKNGVSKSDYIRLFNKAQENNIDIPTKEEFREIEKIGLPLETYIDYKIQVKEVSNNLKSTEENIKDKDRINILLNSDYSDKEKTAIFEKYILSNNEVKYPIVNKTGINIDEYMKYRQQNFEADKIDDGSTTGKSVSGSKKDKVISFINSMDITRQQKTIIAGMEYKLSLNERKEIVEWVKGLNITKQEKMDMLGNFKGITVYKDGTIKY